MRAGDTIFALSSGRPPAAVAVIRISGPLAHESARLVAGALPEPRLATLRQLRDPSSGEFLDQALVLRFDSPATATGENVIEFQCHGGRAVVDAVLGVLTSLEGFRPAEPGEFTRRAFERGRIDLTEAEGLADLIEAETESQRKAALLLAEGGLRRQIALWETRLLALSAEVERAIDYETDEPVDGALRSECAELASELRSWLNRPLVERLKDGVRIVVAGPPNAGKSSLVNAIAGEERSIVTALPGTTRDHIEVPLAIGGVPVVLTDTAGLREASDEVEAIGIDRAENLIRSADILIWLGRPEEAPAHTEVVMVQSKADLPESLPPPDGTLAVSAFSGLGVAELLRRIGDLARRILPGEGALALNRRQAGHLDEAGTALARASAGHDVLLIAEDLRLARSAFDALTGRSGVEELLDALFSRFCLGK